MLNLLFISGLRIFHKNNEHLGFALEAFPDYLIIFHEKTKFLQSNFTLQEFLSIHITYREIAATSS
jgi:hypothetical protein